MGALLDLGYLLGTVVLSPWIVYRLTVSRGWHELAARAGLKLGAPLEGSIWLHGSSAGEVSLLRPLIARLERELPATPLLLSTFTSTGLEAARKLYPRHRVTPFPLDLSFVVRRFLRRYRPRLVVIVESELWPNFIRAARRSGVPVIVVNGKMSAKSHRLYARTRLIPRVLRELTALGVQTEEHAERYRSLGVASERIRVTGNMKYDLPLPRADDQRTRVLRAALGYADGTVVVIGGSLHAGEDETLLDACRGVDPRGERCALILVPRYPSDAEVFEQHAVERGLKPVRKTAVDAGREQPPGRRGVLIVDTIGELGALYGAADVAFVGGSLFYRGSNKGGHNLMEPAVLGVPVLFGPYNFSFKETVDDLLRADAGRLVRDGRELERALAELVASPDARRALGERGRQVVLRGQGATERNFALLTAALRRDADACSASALNAQCREHPAVQSSLRPAEPTSPSPGPPSRPPAHER
ncbi:MAG TPA: glycosyltransferase N-terminal domain-containing protein [Gammaproteobacteria bacterium]